MPLPKLGTPREELLAQMRENQQRDADWKNGRTFSLIYPAGDDVDELLADANDLYIHGNALNPLRFPSVRQMEIEVVEMTKGLVHAPEGAGGCLTSGGTESILMATLTARERAKAERGVVNGTLVAPYSAHPAFAKAAKYLGLELLQVPLDADYRADVAAAAKLVDERTVLVMGSAPNYPFGTVDPIPELAALAAKRGISFHTDACLGGFMLPWWEQLGERIPPYDLRVDGVSTISADVHKYGYCTKGAAVLIHRDAKHLDSYQRFLFDRWPGGLYFSQAVAGARSSAPIAAAWAILNYLGEEGYLRLARRVHEVTRRFQDGVRAAGMRVVGRPIMGVFAFTSDSPHPFAIGDRLNAKGWGVDRQKNPDALHVMLSPKHLDVIDEFLADLREAIATAGAPTSADVRYS